MTKEHLNCTVSKICLYIVILLLFGFTVGCANEMQTPSPSITPNPTSTKTITPKPTNSPTSTITPSQTATATYTVTPSPTIVLTDTPTFTPTSTPQFVSVMAENAQVYSGPGVAYDLLAIYTQDIKVHAVGRHENNAWVIVLLPDKQGWVSVDKVVVDFEIDTLPVFDIPPTPLPSLTPTPSPSVRFFTSEEEFYLEKEQLNIIIENVIPYEPLKIEVYFPDGERRTYKSVTANPKGNYKEIFRRSFWSKLPDGTYEVVVTGEYGSKVTGSFTLPLDN